MTLSCPPFARKFLIRRKECILAVQPSNEIAHYCRFQVDARLIHARRVPRCGIERYGHSSVSWSLARAKTAPYLPVTAFQIGSRASADARYTPRRVRDPGRAGGMSNRHGFGAPNGSEVHPQDASTRERTSGAPLAAMHRQLTLSVCKRRDAVRLAQNEPARPAGAASSVLSGATSS